MKADNANAAKITVVVRRGIVKSIFIDKRFDTAEVEIVDLDTTDPIEYRRKVLRAKKAKKILNQIY